MLNTQLDLVVADHEHRITRLESWARAVKDDEIEAALRAALRSNPTRSEDEWREFAVGRRIPWAELKTKLATMATE